MRVVGIDVGGTFTDVVLLDEATGEHRVAKVPSTRTREAEGFLRGVRAAAGELDGVSAIVHGTTVGTNALLERTGARTGLITTAGFTDVVEMRRRDRPRTWGLWGDFRPLVERDLRLGVEERTLAGGRIVTGVDPAEVEAAARTLLARGAEAVAICFLHSYADPANEEVAAKVVRDVWPTPHVSVSSELLAEIREFERTSTTALNAYLQPKVGNYLGELEAGLDEAGFSGWFGVVASNGGVMTVADARRLPVRTALSGPAAGVMAAVRIAEAADRPRVICGDMGGTSFDVSVVVDGEAQLTDQTTIDFGQVIRSPMIEITTIGAGGGSIAWVDGGGLLRVGPRSAGAVPGPACYGAGGDRPTVTDANVVLGRINAARPIGDLSHLDVEAARAAIDADVGAPLGLDAEAAAEAILAVATASMSGAVRLVSIERGHDPGGFWLMPFGGAGALHCCDLVDQVGLAGALVPRHPGAVSALGCVMADMRHDLVQTIDQTLDGLDEERFRSRLADMVRTGRARLDDAGMAFADRRLHVEVDMSYVGQTHTVPVVIDGDEPDAAAIGAAFDAAYRRTYGRTLQGIAVRVLTLRVAVTGVRPRLDLGLLVDDGGLADSVAGATVGEREVIVGGRAQPAAVIDRLRLPVGSAVPGPAVLEQPDATTFVAPGFTAVTDEWGNLAVARP